MSEGPKKQGEAANGGPQAEVDPAEGNVEMRDANSAQDGAQEQTIAPSSLPPPSPEQSDDQPMADVPCEKPASAAQATAYFNRKKRARPEDLEKEMNVRPIISPINIADKEVTQGIITFECRTNDGDTESLIKLANMRAVFCRALPKMGATYVARLVFDRRHHTLMLIKNKEVIGGICFRPFFEQGFAEIAFLAVKYEETRKGYATALMNHLKEHLKTMGTGIHTIITCADNEAIGYFKRMGFVPADKAVKEKYKGFIKEYDKVTEMECIILPNVDYRNLPALMVKQQKALDELLMANRPVYTLGDLDKTEGNNKKPRLIPGLAEILAKYPDIQPNGKLPPPPILPFPSSLPRKPAVPTPQPPASIEKPRVAQSGRGQSKRQPHPRKGKESGFQKQCLAVLDKLIKHEKSWPYVKPVKAADAPGYYDIIKEPTDVGTMQKKAKANKFESKEAFVEELNRIWDNARLYNDKSTVYYQFADDLQTYIAPELAALKERGADE
ncbi:unnamed protein product [Vitrella brassicaformis CCMP3155]|uniref:Histone acetyltransferase n=2 Tax=Vitrella brassicaformis TaxID=1169539 RepID=A0A0G4ERX9_VITBC|nr:unnamed protein product [Vitrella brassicaformis CCMP3155]|mmetsp:Transcript_6344/g.15304  ORF Transcript_6344/g.15304 Transcript_6344/m.15304 type:complete len:499 (+) Transcript_6344:217-1713(+)|eukprot:CEM00620.1 unnamed protein product [Vitrella brassicaformis CCMP3155]